MKILSWAACAVLVLLSSVAQAGEHAHFAAFFNNQTQQGFSFPAVVKGDNIEQNLTQAGAEMMLFAHSAGTQNGDVWSLQNNTLRDMNGALQDFGLDCQLSLNTKPFKVAGLCAVFMAGHEGAGQEKMKQIIKPMTLKDEVVWYKIFEDKEHGVAGYFMRETAADFNH